MCLTRAALGLCRGVVLLNAAGRFDDPNAPTKVPEGAAAAAADVDPGMWNRMMDQVSSFTKRSMVMASFYYAKSPMRIRQVLRQVRGLGRGEAVEVRSLLWYIRILKEM